MFSFFTKHLSSLLSVLLAVLFVLLPFHAFGVTSLTHFFGEVGAPAPLFLKMWKEILLCIIFFLLIAYLIVEKKGTSLLNFDTLDYCIIGFSVLAFFLSFFQKISGEFSLYSFIYGIKYTLFPLWIFFLFRRIPQNISDQFFKIFWKIFPFFAGGIIFSGIVFFILAQSVPEFFIFLGYSTDHSFYSLFQPLSSCQKISFTEICRAQGVFSGPNQMGAYLIFLGMGIFGFYVGAITNRLNMNQSDICNASLGKTQKIFFWMLCIVGVVLLVLTFSRSAWIGAFFAGIFFLFFLPEISRKIKKNILVGMIILPFLGTLGLSLFAPEISDKIINRESSSSQHYELSLEAGKNILENPLGYGLGTAGAASKYESQKGIKEVGFIPENWYLQIGIETGVLGIFLWLGIIFFVMKKLVQKNIETLEKNVETRCTVSLQNISKINFPLSLASGIFGISIMGLFLHSWESSAVAYTVWGLAGIMLRKN